MAVTITRTHWIDDDGTGTTGTIINDAAKQEIYGQIDAALAQVPQLSGTNTWTGDQTVTGSVKASADLYEKGRTTPVGHWIDIPYSAGNFTANTGSWTVDAGDVTVFAYTLIGKTLWLTFWLVTTSVSGSPSYLYLNLPAGLTPARNQNAPITGYDNATLVSTYARIIAGDAKVYCGRADLATWATSTNNTQLYGNLVISLQ